VARGEQRDALETGAVGERHEERKAEFESRKESF
jgi:hypothetical protein